MLDAVVRNEGEPDVVQISGGEPTLHPEFFAVLDAAKRRPIKHLMVNTNGIRIAQDEAFAERLADVHARASRSTCSSTRSSASALLRAARRRPARDARSGRWSGSTGWTSRPRWSSRSRRGANDGELGRIVEFALQQPCVRGVTFQPIQAAGRLEGFDPAEHRLTLTEVRRRILEQTQRLPRPRTSSRCPATRTAWRWPTR